MRRLFVVHLLEVGAATAGILCQLVNAFGSPELEPLDDFLGKLFFYARQCDGKRGENGEIRHRDLLPLCTAAFKDFSSIDFPKDVNEDKSVSTFYQIVSELCKRFCHKIDEVGLAFLRDSMVVAGIDIKAVSDQAFKPPTATLQKAILTCGLIQGLPKLKEELSSLSGAEGGATLAKLAGVVPLYMEATSVHGQLMETLSEETMQVCMKFQKTVDSMLAECSTNFGRSLSQLKQLIGKYESLGFAAAFLFFCFPHSNPFQL